jgi:3-oxoadipate enol-lactonase
MPPSKESIARFMKGLELYKEKGATAFRANWLADPLFAQINKKPKPRRRIEEMVAAFQLDTFLKILSRPATPSSATQLQRLSEVKMPTLVMIGELDQPEIRAAADAAVKAIPGARKIVYPGVGHIINMEQPKKFNRDLESFLGSVRNRQ